MTDERIGARRTPRGGRRALAILAVVLAAGSAQADSAGDTAAGKKVFGRCQSCHQLGPTARNGIGPELNGVIGRTSGTVPGYVYSAALKSGAVVWDASTLPPFLKTPAAVAKGTRMPPQSLKDTDVANLVAYLAMFAADGTPAL